MQRLYSLLCYIRIYTCGSDVGFVGHVSRVFVFVVFFKFQIIAVVSIDVFNITNEQSLLSLFAKSSQGEFDECLQSLFFQCVFFFVLVVLSFSQSVSQLYFRPFSPDL